MPPQILAGLFASYRGKIHPFVKVALAVATGVGM